MNLVQRARMILRPHCPSNGLSKIQTSKQRNNLLQPKSNTPRLSGRKIATENTTRTQQSTTIISKLLLCQPPSEATQSGKPLPTRLIPRHAIITSACCVHAFLAWIGLRTRIRVEVKLDLVLLLHSGLQCSWSCIGMLAELGFDATKLKKSFGVEVWIPRVRRGVRRPLGDGKRVVVSPLTVIGSLLLSLLTLLLLPGKIDAASVGLIVLALAIYEVVDSTVAKGQSISTCEGNFQLRQ